MTPGALGQAPSAPQPAGAPASTLKTTAPSSATATTMTTAAAAAATTTATATTATTTTTTTTTTTATTTTPPPNGWRRVTRRRLVGRQFYALIWKDFVVHKRHYIWSLLEMTIPVLVCALAILSNSHQGKAKLEPEVAFEPDDHEHLYGELTPARHKLLLAPNTSFTRALADQVDDGAVQIELVDTEARLVELIKAEIPVSLDQVRRLLPDASSNVTIGGVFVGPGRANGPHFEVISRLDNRPMRIPVELDLRIRAKDFRLGPEPFPKKYSLGPFTHATHYTATSFMAAQVMISRAYINLLAAYAAAAAAGAGNATSSAGPTLPLLAGNVSVPTNEQLIGQRMPYPKYVAHKRLRESTVGTFVAGSQKQKPFVLTMDYCMAVGFLVTIIFLVKRIVDEKKSRVRDMLRLVGISDWTYYSSHMTNTMLIMLLQCLLITLLFTGHRDAPAQNVEQSLLLAIFVLYCLSAVMFVLFLSTLFKSSTKAIISSALIWLALPEVLDRVFKMNAGVIESNGFLQVNEYFHLAFSVIPNFGLRLMNRLLTECDIYGEFYSKIHLYGEYRATWGNIFTVLPLYKQATVGRLMLVQLASVPIYALLIYLSNTFNEPLDQLGLATLSAATEAAKKSPQKPALAGKLYQAIRTLLGVLVALVVAPFRLLRPLLGAQRGPSPAHAHTHPGAGQHWLPADHLDGRPRWSDLSQATATIFAPANAADAGAGAKADPRSAYLNPSFELGSSDQLAAAGAVGSKPAGGIELANYPPPPDSAEASPEHFARYFEPAPKMLQVGVSVRNLCKTYYSTDGSSVLAVRNASLDMYYGQILVLLGHNGAGKTTLIDIISGHTSKTSGQVLIDGFDIDQQPAEARRQVGFCPQFDVLFTRLTVEEHLYFYGLVKGADGDDLAAEIRQLLKQSGLDKHRHKLSKALSGGYKRKLSLAIAMIADSRVLILDEPTSGMDPESRRKVWDFLQLIRSERLVLMTTHHMEEADALGDRIAVMSAGQVRCCGSALFLKRVFNAGYHLRISKTSPLLAPTTASGSAWNEAEFNRLIGDKYKLRDRLENVTPHELVYRFDVDDTQHLLPALFDELERHKDAVGVFGFGVSVATMDDVFMRIGLHFKDVEAQEMLSKFQLSLASASQASAAGSGPAPPGGAPVETGGQPLPRLGAGRRLFRQQLRALLTKRWQHARRNWFQLVWIMGVSLACVVGVVALLDLVIFKEELTPEWRREMTLEGAGYGRGTRALWQFGSEQSAAASAEDYEALRDAAFPAPAAATVAPAPAPTTTAPATSAVPPAPTQAAPETSTTAAGETFVREPAPDQPETRPRPRRRRRIRRAAAAAAAAFGIEPRNESQRFLDEFWLPEARQTGIEHPLLLYSDVNTQMIDLLTEQFADFRERYIVGGERTGNKYVAWYNGEATHSFPISMNIMLNAILKQFTDLISDQHHPLKGSRISLTHIAMAQINTLIAFLPHLGRLINLVFLPFSLAFITSYFVIFPTHERVTRSKHLQLMTGVSLQTFWLAHFLFDLILYGLYTISVLIIYFTWDRILNDRRIYFANFEHSVALVALVTLFIFGALPLAYIFSFIAKKPTSAFSSFCVLTILTGTATLTLVSLYELKYEQTASLALRWAFTVFIWLARLVPSVSLLIGLQKLFALNTTRSICINISPEVLDLLCKYVNSPLVDEELKVLRPERCCRQVCADECYDQWPFFWVSWFGVNVELAMLVLDAFLYWFVLVMIEAPGVRSKVWRLVCFCSPISGLWRLISRLRKFSSWHVPQHQFSSHLGFDSKPAVNHYKHHNKLFPNGAIRTNGMSTDNKDDTSKCDAIMLERLRIRQVVESQRTQDYSMVVNDLTKIYKTNRFKAVDALSFLVEECEFFGLLGVNGAGKSTTFKMLTGELAPTSGNSWIGDANVFGARRDYLRKIGYCPQQDALIDNLTGTEMLSLFARLRGIPEKYVESAVSETLNKLGLARNGSIACNNYSGGNKRRLSVGIALIGAPEMVFLDEPTSGVDPRSRRRLWTTLIEFQKETKSAIVMTSHSMNECECLCDRVAIMVGGKFKVIGSIQYLRTRLSQGFSLILKLRPQQLASLKDLQETSEHIDTYLKEAFGKLKTRITLKDLHQTIMQYHIEPSSELNWSKMLVLLEEAKQQLQLEDYQITSDASLESIFLQLAQEQHQQRQGGLDNGAPISC